MPDVRVDTSEVRALSSRLATSGVRVGAQAALAFRRTVLAIEADAKVLAPVDTGNLRNSISSTVAGDGRSRAMVAEIGPTAEYGIYQEFGTSTQPGQPYLGPAFDRQMPTYMAVLAQLAAEGTG